MRTHSKQPNVARHHIVGLLSFFLFFITFSSFVLANPNWNNFGNQGITYPPPWSRGTIFASNYPQGNLNFTKITNYDGIDFSPLIEDFNYDGQNEMILLFGQNIRLYDNKGSFLDTYAVNGTICGNGNIINFNRDFYKQVIVKTSAVGGYYYYILGTYGTTFTLIKSYFYTTSMTSNCDLYGGVDYNDDRSIWSINTNASIVRYNMDTDSIIVYPYTSSTITVSQCAKSSPYFHAGSCSIDYGGQRSLYFKSFGGSAIINVTRFNIETNTFSTVSTGQSITSHDCSIAECGNIGSPSSSPEIFSSQFQAGNLHTYKIYSYDLATVTSITASLEVGANGNTKSLPVVGDINLDQQNEFCIRTTENRIACYNGAYTNIFNVTVDSGDFSGIISMGLYDDTQTYMQLISSTGLYTINSSLTGVTDTVSFTGTQGMVLPVALENSASFKKDLVYVQALAFDYYIGSGTLAVCGNDICEYSENQFNCPQDCFNTNNSASAGTVQNGYECLNDSWCISGTCNVLTGTCQGLSQGAVCNSDAQCGSGDCNNNKLCTQTAWTDQFSLFLKEIGFGNVAGLFFIGLLIIFACAIMGVKFGGLQGMFIGTAVGVLMSVLVFSLISLWFLFFFFMILIVLGVMMFIFGKKESG